MILRSWLLCLAGLFTAAAPARANVTVEIVDRGVVRGRTEQAVPGESGNGLEAAKPMTGVRYVERSEWIEARLRRSSG